MLTRDGLDRDVLTAFACVIADQQLRTCLDVLKQAERWFPEDSSAKAAVWKTIQRMEATRVVVNGLSYTLMADMGDLVDAGENVPQTSPKRPRGRPRKTVSNANKRP